MSKPVLSPVIKGRENRRWDLTSNPLMQQEQAIVCPYAKCGKIFSEPIALTVLASGSHETYHACPYCFSRLSVSENLEKGLSEASKETSQDTPKGTKNDDDAGNCAHYVGYLKTRPKDAPIPDECLTCNRILKCM